MHHTDWYFDDGTIYRQKPGAHGAHGAHGFLFSLRSTFMEKEKEN
jgi:hypothetical protein